MQPEEVASWLESHGLNGWSFTFETEDVFGGGRLCITKQDVVAMEDSGQFIEDRVRGEVYLVKENPVALLDALDQRPFDELEDEAATRGQLLRTFLQVFRLALELIDLTELLL